jgi:hypothetical protein
MKTLIFIFLLFFSTPAFAQLVNVSSDSNIVEYVPSSYNSPRNETASKAFDGSASTKYLNFDKQNMGVGIRLTTGRPVSSIKFITANDSAGRDPMTFSLFGSNDGVTWFIIIQNTPTQVSTDRYAQSPITILSNTTAYAYYFIQFPTMRNTGDNSIQIGEIQLLYDSASTATSTATGSMTLGGVSSATAPSSEPTYPTTSIDTNQTIKLGQTNAITSNSIYIENIGDNNTVNIEQFSKFNAIRGVNGSQSMLINGRNNTITINQGTAAATLGNNLVEVSVIGDGNTVSLTQQYNGKYTELVMNGTGNQLTAQQKDVGGKSAFFNILGNSNVITTLQQGTGNHFLDISAPYGGLNANITQSGSAQKLFKLVINNPGIGVTVSQTAASVTDSVLMSITCATGPCTGYSYIKN